MWDISSEAISLSAFSVWGVVRIGYLSQWPWPLFGVSLNILIHSFISGTFILTLSCCLATRGEKGEHRQQRSFHPSLPQRGWWWAQCLRPSLAGESLPSLHPKEPSAAICGRGSKGIQNLTIFWVSVLILQLKWWGYFYIETWAKFSFVYSPDSTLGSELGCL